MENLGLSGLCCFVLSILPLRPLRRGTLGGTALIIYYLSLYFWSLTFDL